MVELESSTPISPYIYDRFYAARANLPMHVQDDLHSGNIWEHLRGISYVFQHSHEPVSNVIRASWWAVPATFMASGISEFCEHMHHTYPQHNYALGFTSDLALVGALASCASFVIPLAFAIHKQHHASDAEIATWVTPQTILADPSIAQSHGTVQQHPHQIAR